MIRSLLFSVCLLLIPATTFAAGPAEEIAPLLNGKSTVVVRIDLTAIDIQKVVAGVTGTVEEVLVAMDMPKEEADQYKGLIMMGAAAATMQVQGILTKLAKEGGATEAFLVVDVEPDPMDPQQKVFVAIPVGEKKKTQTDAIRLAYRDMQMGVNFVRHGFVIGLVVANEDEKTDMMAFAKERFGTLAPAEYPVLADAFAAYAKSPITAVILPSETYKTNFTTQDPELPAGVQLPPEFQAQMEMAKKASMLMRDSLLWTAIAADPQALSLEYTIKVDNADNAKELVDIQKKQLDATLAMMEMFGGDMLPVDIPTIRQAADLLMPKPQGDALTGKIDKKLFEDNAEVFGKVAKAALEAAQAAFQQGFQQGEEIGEGIRIRMEMEENE